MATDKPINYRPRVGELVECNFGNWAIDNNFDGDISPEIFDGHIPPEMKKRRMVIVINPRLDGKSTIVVPISSNKSNKFNSLNEILPNDLFKVTNFYDKRERYALCNRVITVSNKRLFQIRDKGLPIKQTLPNEIITAIQKKIIKAINAQSLINDVEKLEAEIEKLKNELNCLKK
ncbi:type II toxin-antitoxin system PemK/MazF family toxin [Gallibacterium anatis]|uniref:type II toxin-antitoxin system PemK/MazF family toxin n=1 Tax=Gallibacterium anatis TaxID=750 RepID=UPI003003BC2E